MNLNQKVDESFLLGTSHNNELIFCNLCIRFDESGVGKFSCSFNSVSPLILTDDVINTAIESYIENLDSESHLNLLLNFDCKPSELLDEIANNSYNPIEEFFDNSLYAETYTIGDSEIFFESCSCGQHDTRNEISDYFISTDFYNYIHFLWDSKHLNNLSDSELLKLNSYLESEVFNQDECEIVESWLSKIICELN